MSPKRVRVPYSRFVRSTPGQVETACGSCGRALFVFPSALKDNPNQFCDMACCIAWRGARHGDKAPARSATRADSMRGANNPRWVGEAAGEEAGRKRAQRLYDLGDCERCGAAATDRHHRDGNTHNNAPENIERLCRSCHMKVDGRLEALQAPCRARAVLESEAA